MQPNKISVVEINIIPYPLPLPPVQFLNLTTTNANIICNGNKNNTVEWETKINDCFTNNTCVTDIFMKMFQHDFIECENSTNNVFVWNKHTANNCLMLHNCKMSCDEFPLYWKNVYLNECYEKCYECVHVYYIYNHYKNRHSSNNDNLGFIAFGVFIVAFVFFIACKNESVKTYFHTNSFVGGMTDGETR